MANYISRNEQLMEKRVFGDYSFPFEIFYNTLSKMEHGFVDPHWHAELEFTIVQDGEMEYQVNNTIFKLNKGKGVFSNSKCIHTARPYPYIDCNFYSIVFNPILVLSHENSSLNHYVEDIVNSNRLPSLLLDREIPWQNYILNLFSEIGEIYQNHDQGYDLVIKGKLCEFWVIFYNGTIPFFRDENISESKNIQQMKKVLSFIQENYSRKLTLTEIANSANVSKGECCRFFKSVMKQSPYDYLISYRIQKSIPLLLFSTEYSITQIAYAVGFNNSSYYSEIFRRMMNCSPSEYRTRHQDKTKEIEQH